MKVCRLSEVRTGKTGAEMVIDGFKMVFQIVKTELLWRILTYLFFFKHLK